MPKPSSVLYIAAIMVLVLAVYYLFVDREAGRRLVKTLRWLFFIVFVFACIVLIWGIVANITARLS